MIAEQYRSSLEANELLVQLGRLFLAQRQADRLICRYLADLADGLGKCPKLAMSYGDVYQLVRARFGLSTRSIRERIRVGRALRVLPLLEAALMSGRLTYSRIREVTRVANPDTESVWLEAARRLSMRALESRVGEASGGRSPDSHAVPNPIEPAKVSVSIPSDVWELLKQAMQVVKATCDLELTDAEALAEVARSALAHEGAVPDQVAVVANENVAGPTAKVTHGGSSEAGGVTHGGSSEAGDGTHDDALRKLSPDARLILDQVRTGGLWNFATLCDVTGLSPGRLACALPELERARIVERESLGLFEAVRMARPKRVRTARLKRAGWGP